MRNHLTLAYAQQPLGAELPINWEDPITKDQVIALSGGSWRTRNGVNGKAITTTGTKITNGKTGKAWGFGATVGAGTTDGIIIPGDSDFFERTYMMRVRRDGTGGGGLGRLWDRIDSGLTKGDGCWVTSGLLQVRTYWAASPIDVTVTAPALGVTFDLVVALRLLAGSPSTCITHIYFDGVLVQTASTTPAGAPGIGALTNLGVGNRAYGTMDRGHDGTIENFHVLNRFATAEDARRYTENNLVFFAPNYWDYNVISGGTTAVSQDYDSDYDVIGRVQQDMASTYAVKGAVQKDYDSEFDILSESSVVSQYDSAYYVKGKVEKDLSQTFSLYGNVAKDGSYAYAIRGAVQKDLSSAYNILATEASIITEPFGNNTGNEAAVADETDIFVHALRFSDLVSAVRLEDQALDGSNVLTITNAALEADEEYLLVTKGPNGYGVEKYTAV